MQGDGTLRKIANVGPKQVLAALNNKKLKGPLLEDYNGDLQIRSVWSDGKQTFVGIAEAGLARGYSFCAVTDHSYGLKIARGVSMADLKKQQKEIDAVNREYGKRFRVIKGIEANILADGTVDMKPWPNAPCALDACSPWTATPMPRVSW